MKAAKLKEYLKSALEKIEALDDCDEIAVESNTYFLGDCSMFLGLSSEGYINLDRLEVEKVEQVTLHDIDLTVTLDDEPAQEGMMTFNELQKLCINNNVKVKLEERKGAGGWPTFCFDGLAEDVAAVLDALGFDETSINEAIEEALA